MNLGNIIEKICAIVTPCGFLMFFLSIASAIYFQEEIFATMAYITFTITIVAAIVWIVVVVLDW